MDIIDNSPEQPPTLLPNLKIHFITITIILVLAIFWGQSYQDHHRNQEHLDAERVNLHHQQAKLVVDLMSNLEELSDSSNDVAVDQAANALLQNTKYLIHVQETLTATIAQRNLNADNEKLAESELDLLSFPSDLLLTTNEVLALLESKKNNPIYISTLHKSVTENSLIYQKEASRFIEKLSAYQEQESIEHRHILWRIVYLIMALVIVVGAVFYRIISGLVKRQFNLLEHDNRLREQNELAMAEQAQHMLEQQMKMRSILDSTVDAIITISADGLIDSFNKSAEVMFGYSSDVVIGKNVKMLMPKQYAEQHDGFLQHYRDTGVRKVIGIGREVTGQHKDGSQFHIHLSVSEVPLSNPKLFTGIVRDITEIKLADEKLKQTMLDLTTKQQMLEEEEKIARHVFENITATNNDSLPELSSWSEPMGSFSGDLILSTALPTGGIRILLCDFTGHGLPAALGAVPVSVTHSAMAKKSLPLDILMDELNNKLRALLPTGIFCCIAGIDIDATRTHAHIWNAGLPEVLIVSKEGKVKQRIVSNHLPLGVVEYDRSEMQSDDVHLDTGDMIYALSDGLTEAESESGDMFGQERFEKLLLTETDADGRLMMIRNEVEKFMGNAAPTDDISLIEVKALVTADEFTLKS